MKQYKRMKKYKGVNNNMGLLAKIAVSLLNGGLIWFVALVIGILLGMVGLGQIGALFTTVALPAGILVGLATFVGVVPNYWAQWIN